jgi:hypothetical protein
MFRGEVQIKDVDSEARSLFIVGRGTDTTGTSGAAMDLRVHVEDAGSSACRLVGASEVSVSGKAATFGGRMMSALADQVLQQFASNFGERVRSVQVVEEAAPAATGEGAPPTTGEATPAAGTEAALAAPAGGGASGVAASVVAAPPVRELNGLALLWALFRDWLHDLFPARRA